MPIELAKIVLARLSLSMVNVTAGRSDKVDFEVRDIRLRGWDRRPLESGSSSPLATDTDSENPPPYSPLLDFLSCD